MFSPASVEFCGRFSYDTKRYPNGNLYRAHGPFAMHGSWHETEEGCYNDFLAMANGLELSDAETKALSGIYEIVHDLRVETK